MDPDPPASLAGGTPSRTPRDDELDQAFDLKPVATPPTASEQFRSGLSWIAFGMLIVVFDINFTSETRTFDVVNDVFGFGALIAGAAKVKSRDRSLDWVPMWAIAGLLFAAVATAVGDPPYLVAAGVGITSGMTFGMVYLGIAALARSQRHRALSVHATIAGILSLIFVPLALIPQEAETEWTAGGGAVAVLLVVGIAVLIWLISIPFIAAKRLRDPHDLTGGG